MEVLVSNEGLQAHIVVARAGGFRLDVSLSIAPGETVALLGPNGAGKSTVVSAITGLVPIDSGRITLGEDVLDDAGTGTFVTADHRRIGVVFQDYLLFPHLSIVENVAFGLRCRRVGRTEALSRSTTWLAQVGLEGLGARRPGDLSGGQAQRVALARALAIEPDLLLLDEPLSALDVTTRDEFRHRLDDHLSVFAGPRLFITHDPTEAFLLADRIHIIESGVITQEGTADEIRLRPATQYAADLAGLNLLAGMAADGAVAVDGHALRVADELADGPVLVTIHPAAVSVHRQRPAGSPRNAWETTVERVESLGTRARLRTGSPLALTIEVTDAARRELDIQPGSGVWVAVKATEIDVRNDEGAE
ncbi:MAG: ATP-binding cassette domain-containing protein [Acidimicrobiia bacterium]